MDKISKALQKFSVEEREKIKSILTDLKSGRVAGLDIKKLKGRGDIFRVRKGQVRIIYQLGGKREVYLLTIERRSGNTYKF